MITITIDIPDNNTIAVIAQLKKLGVKVRESKLAKLDKLTKKDYQRQFSNKAIANMDTTEYLLSSPANAARLLKSVEDYKKGLGKERNLIEKWN